jgi:exopolysaccharide biosynthesis operon protein EpsL
MCKRLTGAVVFWIAIGMQMMIIGNVHATASPDDMIKPYIAANLLYDTNVLRLPKGKPFPKGKSSKGDFVKTVNAGVEMDWKLSRQQFIVKADVNHSWFQNFESLDYLGWDVLAEWNWKIGSDLEGTLGYSNSQKLNEYDQINDLISNESNFSVYRANIAYLFHPQGRIAINLFRTEDEFEDGTRRSSNLTENNAELNLEYLSPTGSAIGVRVLATDGDYPNRQITRTSELDNGYLRMNYGMTYRWVWSEKTRIYGRVGYTQQDFDHLASKDFGDVTAQLNVDWAVTEQAAVFFSAWREIRQVDDIDESFSLSQGVKVTPSWQLTPKIKMYSDLSFEQKDYEESDREDTLWSFGYNIAYEPFHNIMFDLMLGYENKGSTEEFKSYESLSTGLNMQVVF